jgi:hypothetical protein
MPRTARPTAAAREAGAAPCICRSVPIRQDGPSRDRGLLPRAGGATTWPDLLLPSASRTTTALAAVPDPTATPSTRSAAARASGSAVPTLRVRQLHADRHRFSQEKQDLEEHGWIRGRSMAGTGRSQRNGGRERGIFRRANEEGNESIFIGCGSQPYRMASLPKLVHITAEWASVLNTVERAHLFSGTAPTLQKALQLSGHRCLIL